MKILYIHNSKVYGGMEKHVHYLVDIMLKKGHEVFVWCPAGYPEDLYKQAGAQVTEREILKDIDFSYIKDLTSFLKEHEINIVHINELKPVVNGLIAAHFAKTPVRISHSHTPISEWQVPSWKKRINTFVYRLIVNAFSDAEIALAETKKKVKVSEGIRADKIVVIPNGLDLENFSPSQIVKLEYEEEMRKKYGINKNCFVFGTTSRLSKEKGYDVLIEGFAKFLASDLYHDKNFLLFISSTGPLEKELKELALKRGIADKVIFAGGFDEKDKVRLYAMFDFYVFPSRAEGFGYVLIEALYTGIPVVCSDLPVLKEVAGDTATYFRSGDALDLAEKLIERYEKMISEDSKESMRGRERVIDLYSMDVFADNYTKLYERLLNKK